MQWRRPCCRCPLRGRRRPAGTHLVHVRCFSDLRKKHCDDDGFVVSRTFTVTGLDWAIRYFPDQLALFVELVSKDAVAWAYVGFRLIDQATGQPDAVFWETDPTLFDSSNEDSNNWSTDELATRSHLQGSGYVRGDCLKIECVLDVCHDRLTFNDPRPSNISSHAGIGLLGSDEGADLTLEVGGETFTAHSFVLDMQAPRFLKKHNYDKRREKAAGLIQITVDDDIPLASFRALFHCAYTDSLPVVSGLTGDGHKEMLGHFLLAAKRYNMTRLKLICERILCRSIDVETVSTTLAMDDQHGFKKLREACFDSPLKQRNSQSSRKLDQRNY